MNTKLNQILENLNNMNVKVAQLIEANNASRQTSFFIHSDKKVKLQPEICQTLHMSLFPLIYKNFN